MQQTLFHFPLWWYWHSLNWWKRFFKNLLIFLNQQLALTLMAGMVLIPLWHDTSLLGRVLSFIFRAIKIVVGLTVMTVTILAMGFWLLVWLLIPPAIIAILKWPGAIILALIWLTDIYRFSQLEKQKYFGPSLIKLVKESSNHVAEFKSKLLKLPV